ncbi:hypothetical protein K7402_04965 [Pseudomonas fluorescens group sp.]|uniref:Uncharacterized protein n=2 Tax=Pseudomonas fluorescens TaxID=294 RepID=C3KA28_PSEFS|nr:MULTISPECIES: hypothetical protein [Pseudomonas fluorescens group]MBZ6453892.1 hypothetical protein [Pseudomonas fluorescens group sp.]MBZ6459878.1 hypothetical protein [Pseudomonas fluorescens group sp.]MBZ6466769.1 hypothetical protein [Pseudomonas fluorescens group sp.]WQD75053.1 hypothetical protein U0037_14255 [Pseudomonas marginalis]CAI2797074.1 Uncharacterized protein PFLU_2851 [Pseudomonas fluorescens SBW25]
MQTSSSRHTVQTRDQVLVAHAANQIARTSLSQDDFAQALSRELHLSCPEKAIAKEVPDFAALTLQNDVADFVRATGRWLKRVQRWLNGDQEMPSWLEESWVNALEPEFRDHCVNELASRHGLTGARQMTSDLCANKSFGALIRALGDVIDTGSEVFDDQVMCEQDLPHLPAFAKQCRQVEAKAGELGRKAEQLMKDARPNLKSIA